MGKNKTNFLMKIWKKIRPPTREPVKVDQSPVTVWDGVSMTKSRVSSDISSEARKWLKLYVRTGNARRSSKLFYMAQTRVSEFFSKEQLDEHILLHQLRRDREGKVLWTETIQKHLRENGIVIDL